MSRNAKLYFCGLLESGADPVKELYPFIDDYTWVVAQQYENITIGGVQYPFQDSAKTTPVTANGDPVGAVVGLRGTPDTVQTVSADRPVWSADGVEFDGLNTFLDSQVRVEPGTGACTVIACLRDDSGQSGVFICTAFMTQTSANRAGFWISRRAENNLQIQLYDAGGSPIFNTVPALPGGSVWTDGSFHTIALMIDAANGVFRAYFDGVNILDTTFTPQNLPSAQDLKIAQDAGLTGLRHWDGPVKALFAVDAEIPGADILRISNELLA